MHWLLLALTTVLFPHSESAAPVHPIVTQAIVRVPPTAATEPWAARFPRTSADYLIRFADGSQATIARGSAIPLDGVTLPPQVAGRRIILRATLYDDDVLRIGPAHDVVERYRGDLVGLTGFLGFFLAIGIINIVTTLVLRSVPSAWYAAIAWVAALEMAYSAGSLRPLYRGSPVVDQVLHAAIIAIYLFCVTYFAFALLKTWRDDRRASWAVCSLFVINVVLVFVEDLLGSLWPYYAVDQIALDALLVALVVLGFRALRRGSAPYARWYLIAFIGPLAGIPIADLATHNIISGDITSYSFELGIAWEAVFFACGVALSNRALAKERDWFNVLAHADALTGISNRRTFDEVLERQWLLAARTRSTLGVVMLDIDHFKRLNDTQGHRAGDQVLRSVAGLCAAMITREGDCFARYGGEEFVAVLPGVSADGARAVAERMRAAVERAMPVTISAGVASMVPRPDIDAGALVVAADGALYRAKESGRNRVCSA